MLLINAGLGYKHISYTESKRLSAYVGIGAGSFIQFQAGFSKDGFSLRNRYEMPIGVLFEEFTRKNPYLGLITISVSIEKYFKNPQMNWYFGVGVGISINHWCGLNCY